MNPWMLFTWLYLILAFLTFIPTLRAIFKRIKLHPGGSSFAQSQHFSEEMKECLEQHYSRIQGTLAYWKNQAEKYRHFHYYCLC